MTPARSARNARDLDLAGFVLALFLVLLAVAASRSAQTTEPSPSRDLSATPAPSAELSRVSRPSDSPAPRSSAPVPPAAGATSQPLELVTRDGLISHVGAGFGRDYLALPCRTEANVHCGLTVRLCGPADCRTMVQTDYGPSQRIYPDRIADVGPATFVELCGQPASRGLCNGTWTAVERPGLTLPPTETRP
jgi:hypothetical protein